MVRQAVTRPPAEAKALAQAAAGKRPVLSEVIRDTHRTTRRYLVPSGSRPGHAWLVDEIGTVNGVSYACDCPAGAAGQICWHVAAVAMLAAGTLPERQPVAEKYGLGRLTGADLFGPRR